jgi:hypothetical protein
VIDFAFLLKELRLNGALSHIEDALPAQVRPALGARTAAPLLVFLCAAGFFLSPPWRGLLTRRR